MATKAATSRACLVKGKQSITQLYPQYSLLTSSSFGWVNASYIYGMTLLSAHQRRALGALTKWDDYEKAMSNLGLS
jgi:hypothetical protein